MILAFVVIGAFSYTKLGLDFLPELDFPYVTVTTVYPGAGPKEVETLITEEIEDAVSTVDGIKHVRSTSMENYSQVFIEFAMGVDVDFAAMDVREKVDAIKAELPDDAEAPAILKFDPNAKPVVYLAVHGERPVNELWEFADDVLKDRLSGVPGVAAVEIVGGKTREILIAADQGRLAACQLSVLDLVDRLGRENLDLPSGHITESRTEYTVRMDGEFETVEQIRNLDLVTPDDKVVYLRDVAEVLDTFEEQRSLARFAGKECVGLTIKKKAEANVVRVVDKVLDAVERAKRQLPSGVRLEVVDEESAFIRESVRDLRNNILLGIALTAVVLYLFLHSATSTVIVAIAMPVAIISTFTLILFAGFTLNVMSLMGMAVCVGILVDNAIVVLESIHRHLEQKNSSAEAATSGTTEVTLAVIGATLTNLVVFVPIAFMSGMIGQFFKQFGLAITFATFMSMLISFTLTPILASKLLRRRAPDDDHEGLVSHSERGKFLSYLVAFFSVFPDTVASFFRLWDWAYELLARAYVWTLDRALPRRWVVLFIAAALFLASFVLVPRLGVEFVSEPDMGKLTLFLETPPGTPLTETDRVLSQVNEAIMGLEEVKHTYTTVGKLEGTFGRTSEGVHVGQVLIVCRDKWDRDRTIEEVAEVLRDKTAGVPDADITIHRASPMGAEAPVQLEISGPEFDKLQEVAERVQGALTRVPGAVDVDSTWRSGKPEIVAVPDRKRIADHGLAVAKVARVMRAGIEGLVASQFRVAGREYDIRVKLAETDRQDSNQVRDILIPIKDKPGVPLVSFVALEPRTGPTQIIRKDKQRVIIISANLAGRPLGDLVSDATAKLDTHRDEWFPPGYDYYFGGSTEMMREAFQDLLMAFGLAIILSYLVLAGLLESFIQPFTIMLTLPLALIGVFASLYVSGLTISIFSLMSIVMLVGIVVNNAILLLDYTNTLRKAGQTRREALLQACRTRLRPIIMTNIATVMGMLPVTLSQGLGSEIRVPMAVVSIGGLMISAVLTLFVIPSVYTIFDDLAALFTRRRESQPSDAPGDG